MPRKKAEPKAEVAVPEVRPDGQVLESVPTWSTEEDRAYAAHKLRQQGKDWAQVARLTGYANPDTARMVVRSYLQKAAVELAVEHRQEMLQTEIARLDTLQAAIWDQAIEGDVKAVDSVIRIINARAKLLGIDQQSGDKVTNNTVVVSEKDFVKIMQAHAMGEL